MSPALLEAIDQVERFVLTYPSGGTADQIKLLARAVTELGRHQHRLEEQVSACREAVQDLLVLVKSRLHRG